MGMACPAEWIELLDGKDCFFLIFDLTLYFARDPGPMLICFVWTANFSRHRLAINHQYHQRCLVKLWPVGIFLPSCSFDVSVFSSPIPLSFPSTSNMWYTLMKIPVAPGDATRPGLPFLESLTMEDSRELQQSYRTAEVVEAVFGGWIVEAFHSGGT